MCQLLSHVRLFAIPWTVAHQVPLSVEFSRQAQWSGLPFSSLGDLSNPGIKPRSPILQADSLQSEPPETPIYIIKFTNLGGDFSLGKLYLPLTLFTSLFIFYGFNAFVHMKTAFIGCKVQECDKSPRLQMGLLALHHLLSFMISTLRLLLLLYTKLPYVQTSFELVYFITFTCFLLCQYHIAFYQYHFIGLISFQIFFLPFQKLGQSFE